MRKSSHKHAQPYCSLSYCKPCVSFRPGYELKVVLKLLQQSSLLSPSGQSLSIVVFLGGRDSICVGVQAQIFNTAICGSNNKA